MEKVIKTENCIFVVHGFAPELWSCTAFRVTGRLDATKRKTVKCPYCGKQLISVAADTRIEIYRSPKHERQACHEYKTCHACHEQIGIIFA